MFSFIRPVWTYRWFILGSVKREFQSKYLNSLLGATWNVLNPLTQILVYTVIFSQVMRAKLNGIDSGLGYSIYLCAGILIWGLFTELVIRSQNMFLDNANLLKKLNFPRLCLPVTLVINALINFGILFSLFTLFLIFTGNFPGVVYIALLPLLILLLAFAIGLGMVLGILNVFFRDVGQFFGIFVTFWFWLTPIVYPVSILPPEIQSLMWINPMAALIKGFQTVLVLKHWPDWTSLGWMLILSGLFCWWGFRLFRKRAGEMVDEL